MKIVYLLPPSEGKNVWWKLWNESLSFEFPKPLEIAKNATQKDLKCKDKRFDEAIALNTSITVWEKLSAISRYSGVMYNAIDYSGLSEDGKQYFDSHFLILSGMYGVLRPQDMIGNYKLPIETKGLYSFWWDSITQALNDMDIDYVVDFLPGAYKKMIDWKQLNAHRVEIDFFHYKWNELKKMTHGVKKVKGEYIHELCKNAVQSIKDFPGEIIFQEEKQTNIRVI